MSLLPASSEYAELELRIQNLQPELELRIQNLQSELKLRIWNFQPELELVIQKLQASDRATHRARSPWLKCIYRKRVQNYVCNMKQLRIVIKLDKF